MLRTIKSRGGLTRDRGFTESVRILWVYSMHKCASMHQSMSELTGLKQTTSEQHVDMGRTRIKRDFNDLSAMVSWIKSRDPFDMSDITLRSISSGLAATPEDGVNCDDAENIGEAIQICMDNTIFAEISIKRKDQVKNLATLQNGIKIGDEKVHVDSHILFVRLMVQIERSENTKQYFEYKLTQIPTALFKDSKMRKSNKSSLAIILEKGIPSVAEVTGAKMVIDGGSLLHRVRWRCPCTYNDIVKQYTIYVTEKCGTSTIVFDGYLQGPSTKDNEHIRRSKNMTANVQLRGSMIAHGPQQSFLSNERNKSQFISLLMGALRVDGHSIYQAKNDADTLIVACALNLCCNYLTVVVSDDTDVLVLMVHHFHEDMRELYFFSEASARSKKAVCNSAVKDHLQHPPTLFCTDLETFST